MALDITDLKADVVEALGDWSHSLTLYSPTITRNADAGRETESLGSGTSVTGALFPLMRGGRLPTEIFGRMEKGVENLASHFCALPASASVSEGDVIKKDSIEYDILGVLEFPAHTMLALKERTTSGV